MLLDVEIEINTSCNLTCSYCPRSVKPNPNVEEMSEDVFKRILSELESLKFKGRICYHLYNEPLLSSSLEHFLKMSSQILPQASNVIYTNGLLLTESKLKALIDAGTKFFIVTKHEGASVLPIESYFDSLDDEIKKKIVITNHQKINKSNRGGALPHLNPHQNFPFHIPCRVPTYGAFFTVKGDVITCYEDYFRKNILGNIMEMSLESIRNNSEFKSLCDSLNKGDRSSNAVCSKCSSLQLLPI